MNFTHFKRRGYNSVQDQSWNWRWTDWHRDGFLFDYICFPRQYRPTSAPYLSLS